MACEVTGLGRRQRGALRVPQAIAQPPACCAGLCLGQGCTLANQTTREGNTGRKASSPELYLNSLFLTSPSQVSALDSCTLLCGGASFHMLMNCTQDERARFSSCALSGLAFSVAEDTALGRCNGCPPACCTHCPAAGHLLRLRHHRRLLAHSIKRVSTQETRLLLIHNFPSKKLSQGLLSLHWYPQCRSAEGLKMLPLQNSLAALFLVPQKSMFLSSCLFSLSPPSCGAL